MQKNEKISDIDCFIDLDDTLTTTNSLVYCKVRILKYLFGYTEDVAFNLIQSEIILNQTTLKFLKRHSWHRIYILSGNFQHVVDRFITKFQEEFRKHNIVFLGGRGGMRSAEKIKIADGKPLVSDLREYQALISYTNFHCPFEYSIWNVMKIYLLKGGLLLAFVVRIAFLGKR